MLSFPPREKCYHKNVFDHPVSRMHRHQHESTESPLESSLLKNLDHSQRRGSRLFSPYFRFFCGIRPSETAPFNRVEKQGLCNRLIAESINVACGRFGCKIIIGFSDHPRIAVAV